MADLTTLYRNRQRLNELSSDVNRLINQIDKCVDSLGPASRNMIDCYTIDDARADNGNIQESITNLINYNNTLTGKVLPAINSAITSTSNEITRIEREEEERRVQEAREAEEAAAAAKASVAAKTTTSVVANKVSTVNKVSTLTSRFRRISTGN